MRDFELKKETFFISRSKKYDNIYEVLVGKRIFTMAELFTFAASIGFKRNRRVNFENDRGKDIRSEYFFPQHLMVLYSLMLNDSDTGKDLNIFKDVEQLKKGMKVIEEFAEGGMEVLCEEVFEHKWDASSKLLDDKWKDYEIDLARFVYKEDTTVGF